MHHSYRDEEERRRWQNPEEILADAGIQPNTIFIDLGCGSGFFLRFQPRKSSVPKASYAEWILTVKLLMSCENGLSRLIYEIYG